MEDFDVHEVAKQGIIARHQIIEGQARAYARKSTRVEKSQLGRSTGQQHEINAEIANFWNIVLRPEDFLSEPDGHSGAQWWDGGGKSGLEGDLKVAGKSRPMLTELMKGVVRRQVKTVLVFSEDRLWRDVGICDAIIEIFGRYGVLLIDRNGPIDLSTVEGRAAVRNRAIAAVVQREMCSVNAKRGHHSNRRTGKLTVGPDCLGFRSCGRYTKLARPVHEELQLVNRIFRLYIHGEESGPLSTESICRLLMGEGVQWPLDLQEKVSRKRTEFTRSTIYTWQIRKVLTDCRYQGKQTHGGKEWPCGTFLVDGQTAVSSEIYAAAQAKIAMNRVVGNRAARHNSLAGILRCGICGQSMIAKTSNTRGAADPTKYWCAIHDGEWCWCTHSLPSIRTSIMEEFIAQELWPFLESQMIYSETEGAQSTVAQGRAATLLSIKAQELKLSELKVAALQALSGNMELVAELDRSIRAEIESLQETLLRQEVELKRLEVSFPREKPYFETPQWARIEALRNTLRWAAVVPAKSERELGVYGRSVPPTLIGRVVFMTRWGSILTAVIERTWHPESTKRRLVTLRVAEPNEMLTSVNDFPNPDQFVTGLKRSRLSNKLIFDPHVETPGYKSLNQSIENPNEDKVA
jgi:DNA invertase Pin-like site-specific DNA recombinase